MPALRTPAPAGTFADADSETPASLRMEARLLDGSGSRQFGERFVEGGDQLVDLRLADGEGRRHAQDVSPQAALADQDTATTRPLEDARGGLRVGDLVLLDQL